MDVKAAVGVVKSYLQDLFAEEEARDFLLEEVEPAETGEGWTITVSFLRREAPNRTEMGGAIAVATKPKRTFKVVRLDDSGAVTSMRDWLRQDAR